MTVAALPSAQRRFPSPPAARRSRKAMSSQRPQTLSSAAPTPIPQMLTIQPDSSDPSSSLPPTTLHATRVRADACDLLATYKFP
jgi:hypothetical protein